jgi:hypothetical protein
MHYLLYEDNTHNSIITIITAFSFDFLSDKISEFSYWGKGTYITSCMVTEVTIYNAEYGRKCTVKSKVFMVVKFPCVCHEGTCGMVIELP